jgi:hypothetical protein
MLTDEMLCTILMRSTSLPVVVAPIIGVNRKFSSWFIPSTIIGATSLSQLKENVSHTWSKQTTAFERNIAASAITDARILSFISLPAFARALLP